MKWRCTYHNHTSWSDGKGTVGELIAAADRLGVEELGISDHFVLHPQGKRYAWSIDPEDLHAYVEDVRTWIGQTSIPVRLGLEVDWFPDHADLLHSTLTPHRFDYLIGSVHEIDDFIIDGSPQAWNQISEPEREHVHRTYWIRMRELARSGLFDIIAHLDLTKKFGFSPKADLSSVIDAALDEIASAGAVVELNTAGWYKPCNDAYPSLDLLRRCRDREIPVTLSSDSHQPDHLLRDFDRGLKRLEDAGYEAQDLDRISAS